MLEVDPAGRRIRLSKKAVAEQLEKAELRDYEERQRQDAAPSQSLGSLADKLRGALGRWNRIEPGFPAPIPGIDGYSVFPRPSREEPWSR